MFINDNLYYCQDTWRIDYVLRTINNIFETKANNPNIYVGLQIKQDCCIGIIFMYQYAHFERILLKYRFFDSSSILILIDFNYFLKSTNSIDIEFSKIFPFDNVVDSL